MPRPRNIVPTYCKHSGTGQAVVTLSNGGGRGRDVYLGEYGSDASIVEYGRVLIEWKAGGQSSAVAGGITVAELLLKFLGHAATYYGATSKELRSLKYAIKPVRQLFGPTPAASFGPKALKMVRDRMIENGWCRTEINRQVNRIRRAFKWATSEELIPSSILHGFNHSRAWPTVDRSHRTHRA